MPRGFSTSIVTCALASSAQQKVHASDIEKNNQVNRLFIILSPIHPWGHVVLCPTKFISVPE
jgi:hypothetical protein